MVLPRAVVPGDTAARERAFQQARKDLEGLWKGIKGETYEVLMGSDPSSPTWDCRRRNELGSMTYTLKWDGQDAVIWGTDYCLLLSELRRSGGRSPTWHSAKGKRPFVWVRPNGQEQTVVSCKGDPAIHLVRSATTVPAVPPKPEDRKIKPELQMPLKAQPLEAVTVEKPTASLEGQRGPELRAKLEPVDAKAEPTRPHDAGVSAKLEAPPAAPEERAAEEPSAAKAFRTLLQRLTASNAVPPELAMEVAALSAKTAPGPLAGLPRPPPPQLSPTEAELREALPLGDAAEGSLSPHRKIRPAPAGSDDTDVEVDEVPQVPLLQVGTQVFAFFYGEWHPGTVRSILGDTVEVLWDSEYSVSFVPLHHTRPRYSKEQKSKAKVLLQEVPSLPWGQRLMGCGF